LSIRRCAWGCAIATAALPFGGSIAAQAAPTGRGSDRSRGGADEAGAPIAAAPTSVTVALLIAAIVAQGLDADGALIEFVVAEHQRHACAAAVGLLELALEAAAAAVAQQAQRWASVRAAAPPAAGPGLGALADRDQIGIRAGLDRGWRR
jgi:hypothetical protein